MAQNGQNFLISLTEREKKNPYFQFLKPTHNLFPYFTSLIDSYSRILNFSREDEQEVMKRLADRQSLFNQSLEIYEYQVSTNNSNKQKEDFDDEEKSKISSSLE